MTTTYAASTMPRAVEAAACSDFHWMQHPSAALLWHAQQHFTEVDDRTVVMAASAREVGATPRTTRAKVNKAAGSKATAKKAAVTKAPAKRAVAKTAATRPRQR